MMVCDASRGISAEFGGIRDSCPDIYHLIIISEICIPLPSVIICIWQI